MPILGVHYVGSNVIWTFCELVPIHYVVRSAEVTYLRIDGKNGRAQSEGKSPFHIRFSLGFQLQARRANGRLDRKNPLIEQVGDAGVTGVQFGPLRLTYGCGRGVKNAYGCLVGEVDTDHFLIFVCRHTIFVHCYPFFQKTSWTGPLSYRMTFFTPHGRPHP